MNKRFHVHQVAAGMFLLLSAGMITVKAATYESASFYSGTYMYGTLNTSQSYQISGTTYLHGDPGSVYVYVKGVPYAGESFLVTKSSWGTASATATIASDYSLKAYYGTHTAYVGNISKSVGTWYSK